MSHQAYYERQAATCRRLAEQAVTWEVARRLLSAANDYEQRARDCTALGDEPGTLHYPSYGIADETDHSATRRVQTAAGLVR